LKLTDLQENKNKDFYFVQYCPILRKV